MGQGGDAHPQQPGSPFYPFVRCIIVILSVPRTASLRKFGLSMRRLHEGVITEESNACTMSCLVTRGLRVARWQAIRGDHVPQRWMVNVWKLASEQRTDTTVSQNEKTNQGSLMKVTEREKHKENTREIKIQKARSEDEDQIVSRTRSQGGTT